MSVESSVFVGPAKNAPLFREEDDVFKKSENGSYLMKTFGPAIHVLDAEEWTERTLKKVGLTREQIHHAQLFHGASSASLLAFTNYNESEGALVPTGVLEEKGKIPFCGEIVDGRDGVNAVSISTVWAGLLDGALRYSYRKGDWNPEMGKSLIERSIKILHEEDFESPDEEIDSVNPEIRELCAKTLKVAFESGNFGEFKKHYDLYASSLRRKLDWPEMGINTQRAINRIEVNQKRLLEWQQLDEEEKKLVQQPFPVLYGIKSTREGVHHSVHGVFGEIGLEGGAKAQEIKVIFVPADRIAFVQDLLARNGHANIPVEKIPQKS